MGMNLAQYRLAARENRERLARGLGWFSVVLGVAEILAPRAISRMIGIRPKPGLIRLLGLRELASGVGILTRPETDAWLKSRVAGDAVDLGLLGAAFLSPRSKVGPLTAATMAVAGVAVLDVVCSQDFADRPRNQVVKPDKARGAVHFHKSIIVNRPAEELYRIWRNFPELPRFMRNVVRVEPRDERRSHWIVQGPAGSRVEWDAEVFQDHPNELIAWRALENADVDHAGSVRFERATGGRGTIVRVELQYRPPAGRTGAMIVKLLGKSPERQITADLLRFKQMVETGEVARTEGQPAGRPRSTSRRYDDLVRA